MKLWPLKYLRAQIFIIGHQKNHTTWEITEIGHDSLLVNTPINPTELEGIEKIEVIFRFGSIEKSHSLHSPERHPENNQKILFQTDKPSELRADLCCARD